MNNPSQNDLNAILQRGYKVEIGEYINRGWEIFQVNLGGFIGFCLITAVINLVLTFLGIIPFVGIAASILSAVIGGPLYAGYLIVAFKIRKNQPTTLEDFFKGFQNTYFLQIFLTSLVIGLLILACLMPAIIFAGLASVLSDGNDPNLFFLLLALVLALIGGIIGIYLGVNYTLAIPLVIGKKMSFWPALETSRKLVSQQWFSFFLFVILLGLINMAGALVCLVGLLFTTPLTACAIAAAYESIVGLPTFDPSQA